MKIFFAVESGLVYDYYDEYNLAKEAYQTAQNLSGLEAYLTGKSGVRTKFQTFQTAQLVLHAVSSKTSENLKPDNLNIPKEIKNQDDVLLEKPKFEDPSSNPRLSAIDQVILIAQW